MSLGVKIAAMIIAGVALGLGATWLSVNAIMPGAIQDGPWATNPSIGSPAGGPYIRAAVALHGLFALNRSEAVYYVANRDDSGATLDGSCAYRLDGRDPPARWWSVTPYGSDDYLIANPTNRFSVDGENVWRRRDGRFSISVGTRPQPTNWIPVTAGRFTLVLRLFNPQPQALSAHAILPTIRRLGCS